MTIDSGTSHKICVCLIMVLSCLRSADGTEINEPSLIRLQSAPSWKVPDHSWGSDPRRTLLLTSLGGSQNPAGSSWPTACLEPCVTGHCPPPFPLAGFFFLSKGGGETPCLFPSSLHVMRNRLAFAGKAENYKEGLIDPLVSLKKPVCGL